MTPKQSAIRHAKSEASAPKSALLRLLSDLERVGAVGEAKRLGSIIGRLEAWQNS